MDRNMPRRKKKSAPIPAPLPNQRMWIRIVVNASTPIGILNSLVDYAEDLAFGLEEAVPTYHKNKPRKGKRKRKGRRKSNGGQGKPFAESASYRVLKKITKPIQRDALLKIYTAEGLTAKNLANWISKQIEHSRLTRVDVGTYDLTPEFRKLVNAL